MPASPFTPWLDERVLADDELLVVDKPGGIPTHGGDESLACDVVRRLRERLSRAGEDDYLGVHQRLDVGTSGVLLFVKSRALNARVQDEFEAGSVRKRYVAAVELERGSLLASKQRITLQHRIEREGKRSRVVERGGKPCRAECRVLRRNGARALVELLPETGRTHQLRVQLGAVGAAIAGDREYGGAPAARLYLHAESLELGKLGRRFRAPLPGTFERWVADREAELGDAEELRSKLRDAACRRYPVIGTTEAFRWVNGEGDELWGVEVDLYGRFAVLSVSGSEAFERRAEIAAEVERLGAEGVYLKVRARSDLRQQDHTELAPGAPIAGQPAPPELVVSEGGLRVAVELADGLSTGLFVDQRENRRRIGALARGVRALNLFSYTCSFSVALALGGAREVTSVDLSRRALRRGEENFRLNDLDPARHAFVASDAVRFLERAAARGERFGVIVLDPPSFSTAGKGRVLSAARDYQRLIALSLRVLDDGGHLLCVTNHRGTSDAALRKRALLALEAERKRADDVRVLPSALDCPPGIGGPSPAKSVLIRLAAAKSR